MAGLEQNTRRNPWGAVVASVSSNGRTAKVEVPRVVVNAKYGKRERLKTVLLVDVGSASVKAGDRVSIVPCRKISKLKSWKVLEVLSSQS